MLKTSCIFGIIFATSISSGCATSDSAAWANFAEKLTTGLTNAYIKTQEAKAQIKLAEANSVYGNQQYDQAPFDGVDDDSSYEENFHEEYYQPAETTAITEIFDHADNGGRFRYIMAWDAVGPDRRYTAHMEGNTHSGGGALMGIGKMEFSDRRDGKKDDVEFQIFRNEAALIVLRSWNNTRLDIKGLEIQKNGTGNYYITGRTEERHVVTDISLSLSKI